MRNYGIHGYGKWASTMPQPTKPFEHDPHDAESDPEPLPPVAQASAGVLMLLALATVAASLGFVLLAVS
jgi:hypothetical protein